MRAHELLVYLAFVYVSATSLLPWNLFMNAREYFLYKLRNVSTEFIDGRTSNLTELTDLQKSYEGWVTVTSGISCLFGSAFNFITTDRLSNTFRVLMGHVTVLFALIPTVAFTFIPTDSVQHLFFWISMVLASLASLGSTGYIACGLLGLAARFPAKFVQAVMIGQSLAGIVSSLLSLFCQMLTPNALLNGRLFFAVSIIWTVFSVALYWYLASSESANSLRESTPLSNDDSSAAAGLLADSDEGNVDDRWRSVSPQRSLRSGDNGSWRMRVRFVIEATRVEGASVFAVLVGTLAVFPAISSLVASASSSLFWRDYFSAIACFLLFNTGDAVGRLISHSLAMGDVNVALCSFVRVFFIPVFFFCNVVPRHHSPTLFHSDNLFILFMALFAISNGFLYSTATVSATRKVDVELRELTGSLFGFFAVISSLIGSCIGLFLVSVV